jgi:hypothetical protein
MENSTSVHAVVSAVPGSHTFRLCALGSGLASHRVLIAGTVEAAG